MSYPKRLEVLTGNKKIGMAVRDVYRVDDIRTDGEHGARLTLTRMRGQATSAAKLVVWVRYTKHLQNSEFNASRGDGINKVKLRVVERSV